MLRRTVFPLLLMITTPVIVIVVWYTATQQEGSLLGLAAEAFDHPLTLLVDIWPAPTARAAGILGCFVGLQLALRLLLPGGTFQ